MDDVNLWYNTFGYQCNNEAINKQKRMDIHTLACKPARVPTCLPSCLPADWPASLPAYRHTGRQANLPTD
ncbi:hypothetical protein [Phocaeicola coprocola]|uniref:hypothetical protein n=1 Tax=Phocaeicola coprocola TaxID=310298 RepID=UPI001C387E32|nr:hypothetical protein [Phocaeicola coprocola]MBV3866893.1 hypothetical protein [Phocaeicola coprocola]MBV4008072.1 hypothetical protein [Phocaeicola coprocola]MBV4032573.1 hypothetical protein [Phocaeicola coprocola]MBV4039126.1 hypothetical protein [Phocaeicola coprocola]MBV4060787.1 hypothetical protein [Phocaeicola coprocola]